MTRHHRQAFVEPARYGAIASGTRQQDVGDLVIEQLFEGAVGVTRRAVDQQDHPAERAVGVAGHPVVDGHRFG